MQKEAREMLDSISEIVVVEEEEKEEEEEE